MVTWNTLDVLCYVRSSYLLGLLLGEHFPSFHEYCTQTINGWSQVLQQDSLCGNLCPPYKRCVSLDRCNKSTCYDSPTRHWLRDLHHVYICWRLVTFFLTLAYLLFSLKKFQLSNIYYRVLKLNS